jgi:ERCC4-type nuclease
MERLNIIIDTREQRPWSFNPAFVNTTIGTLRQADYALAGDDRFGIERKSLDDLLGTISTGWERFQRELQRMDDAKFVSKVVIVESDFINTCFTTGANNEVIAPKHNHPNLTPQFIAKRIAELTMRNVSVLFAASPELATGLAYHIFMERFKQWQR